MGYEDNPGRYLHSSRKKQEKDSAVTGKRSGKVLNGKHVIFGAILVASTYKQLKFRQKWNRGYLPEEILDSIGILILRNTLPGG